MIRALLALIVLFACLYINDRKKEAEAEAKEAEAKKPTVEQYSKKLSDTFFWLENYLR